jgi:hypothetical protein
VYPPPEPWLPAVREFIETSRRERAEDIAYATPTAGATQALRANSPRASSTSLDGPRCREGPFAALEEPELLLAGEMLMLGEATAAIRGRGREWAKRR